MLKGCPSKHLNSLIFWNRNEYDFPYNIDIGIGLKKNAPLFDFSPCAFIHWHVNTIK